MESSLISDHLVEYVALFHPEDSVFKTSGTGSGPTLMDPERHIIGDLLYRIPAIDHSKRLTFPDTAAPFVFPFYAHIARIHSPPVYHSFVLTTATGDRLYGHACTVYGDMSAERFKVVKMQIAARMMSQDDIGDGDSLPNSLFEPCAIVIFSYHPFHNIFARLLMEFARVHFCTSQLPTAMDADLLYRLLNPLPLPHSNTSLLLQIGELKIDLTCPSLNDPPLADVNFRVLFRLLEPKIIIDIVSALLCEIPVLLLSSSVDILTPCIEAISTLLYPMKWPFIYIPVLPLSLTYLFQAPHPFLLGSLTEALNEPPWPDNALIVDIDHNTLSNTFLIEAAIVVDGECGIGSGGGDDDRLQTGPVFKPLPWHLSWRLWEQMQLHMPYYQYHHPDLVLAQPSNMPYNHALDTSNTPATQAGLRSPVGWFSPTRTSIAYVTANSAVSSTVPVTANVASTTSLLPRLASAEAALSNAFKELLNPLKCIPFMGTVTANIAAIKLSSVMTLKTANDLYSGSDNDIDEIQPDENPTHTISATALTHWVDPVTFRPHISLTTSPPRCSPHVPNIVLLSKPVKGGHGVKDGGNLKDLRALAIADNLRAYGPRDDGSNITAIMGQHRQSVSSVIITEYPTITVTPALVSASSATPYVMQNIPHSNALRSRRISNFESPLHTPSCHSALDVGGAGFGAQIVPFPTDFSSVPFPSTTNITSEISITNIDNAPTARYPTPSVTVKTEICQQPPLIMLPTHLNEETSLKGRNSIGGEPNINVFALRRAFLSVFVSLLRGYRDFIHIPKVVRSEDRLSLRRLVESRLDEENSPFSPLRPVSVMRKTRPTPPLPVPSTETNIITTNSSNSTAQLSNSHSSSPSPSPSPPETRTPPTSKKILNSETRDKIVDEKVIVENDMSTDEDLFDVDGFIAAADLAYRDFLRMFVQTQMFHLFIDERITLQQPDWFDRSVMEKLKRMSLQLRSYANRAKHGLLWKEARPGTSLRFCQRRWFSLQNMRLEYYVPCDPLERAVLKLRNLIRQEEGGVAGKIVNDDGNNVINTSSFRPEIDKLQNDVAALKLENFKGVFELIEGVTKVNVPDSNTSAKLYKTEFIFIVSNPDRDLTLCADNSHTRRDWIKLIRARVNRQAEVQHRRFLQDFYLSALLSRKQQKHVALAVPHSMAMSPLLSVPRAPTSSEESQGMILLSPVSQGHPKLDNLLIPGSARSRTTSFQLLQHTFSSLAMSNVHDKADSTILAQLNLSIFASLFTANVQMETAVLRFLITDSFSDRDAYLFQRNRISTLMSSLEIGNDDMAARIKKATTNRLDTFGKIFADPNQFKSSQSVYNITALTSYLVVSDLALSALFSDLAESTEFQLQMSKHQLSSITRTATVAASLQGASEFLMAALYFALMFVIRRKILQLTDSKSQLEAEQAFSKIATQAKRDFLTVISHELRTPLNGAIGMMQMLLESGLSSDHQTSVLLAAESLGCLMVLIESLLDLRALRSQSEYVAAQPLHSESDDILSSHQLLHDRSSEPEERWNPGCGKLVLAPVNINALMSELSKSFEPHMTLKGIEFCTEMLDFNSFPYRVLTNKARLKQALGNLLSNAQRFTSANGHVRFVASFVVDDDKNSISLNSQSDELAITVLEDIATLESNRVISSVESSTLSISKHRVVGTARIRFEIIDDGIGIAAENLDYIFQPFSRLDQSLTRQADGVGVGLGMPPHKYYEFLPKAIAWQLSRQLNGSLRVKSVLNEGTVMSLEIEVDIVHDTAQTPSTATLSTSLSLSFPVIETPSAVPLVIRVVNPDVTSVTAAPATLIAIGPADDSPVALGPYIAPGTVELQHLHVSSVQPPLVLDISPDISRHASLGHFQLNETLPSFILRKPSSMSLGAILITPKTAPLTSSMKSVITSSRTMPRTVTFSPMNISNLFATPCALPIVDSLPVPILPALAGYRARHVATSAPPLPRSFKKAQVDNCDGPAVPESTMNVPPGPTLAQCIAPTQIIAIAKFNRTDTGVTPVSTPNAATPLFCSIFEAETPRFAQSLHVLLVEDNLLNQRFDVMLMKKLGHTFLLVENGLEAVNAVLAYWKSVDAAKAAVGNTEFVASSVPAIPIVSLPKFDICLMDISMPVMDGLVAAATIRAFELADPTLSRTRLPIIACTAHTDDNMRNQIFTAGMQDVVEKPIIKNVLVEKMIALTEYPNFNVNQKDMCSYPHTCAPSLLVSPMLAPNPNDPSGTGNHTDLRITTLIAQSPQITLNYPTTPITPLGLMSVSPRHNGTFHSRSSQQSLATMVEVDVVDSARVQPETRPTPILFTRIRPLKPEI